jgi:PAS domain S-box-containing protein
VQTKGGGVGKILLVEDNPGDAGLTKIMLAESGTLEVDLIRAERLSEAILTLSKQAIDVILLDLSLPDSNGLDTFKRVQEASRSTPIIVLSGVHDETLGLEAVHRGAQDYLVKGLINADVLARVIRYAIERKWAEERYRSLVAHIPGAVFRCLCNPEWMIVFMSDTFLTLSGYPAENFIGNADRSYSSLIHPEDLGAVRHTILESLATQTPYQVVYRLLHADGGIRWVTEKGQGVSGADGSMLWRDGVLFDITEQKHTEETLRKTEGQLRRLKTMDAIGSLTSGIAHDFNNLITAITGYADVILTRFGPDNALCENVQQIKKASSRAATLTRQLMGLGHKPDHDQEKIADLGQLIANMQEMVQWMVGSDIHVEIVTNSRRMWIYANVGQIERSILLLAVNVRKTMKTDRYLRIEIDNWKDISTVSSPLSDDEIETQILLTIRGMTAPADPSLSAERFKPFVSDKGSTPYAGNSLAGVVDILVQHGGHIEIARTPNQGVAFRIRLPRASEVMESMESNAILQTMEAGYETIMLAEDDEMVRVLLRQAMEQQGYHVLEANDGADAIRVCENYSGSIDMLVTDVAMPGMNGLKVLDKIAARRPDIQVLFISGYAHSAFTEFLETGSELNWLVKPFTTDSLLRRMRTILDHPQSVGNRRESCPISVEQTN